MSKLAINGGPKIRTKLFASQNTMDEKEINAVVEVMKRGRLSGYRGNWCPEFLGGPSVQELEREWSKYFNVKNSIAVNSATSGLHVACGAIGLKPGDEVIVTPYSMTCSATAPMIYGAIPVFADIEKDYYCLDPKSVEEKITDKTKAIIVVSIFGQPYDIRINEIAKKHGLYVIEDAAQALGSDYHHNKEIKYAGTLGDIGVFSFNYGKHLTCGEGGMIVTNNDDLSLKCQLIRNHAEAVINGMDDYESYNLDIGNMIGFNMRMTELQAAIVTEQLKKFQDLQFIRQSNVDVINQIALLPPIEASKVRENCNHTYYVQSFQWNNEVSEGIDRDTFINAVKAELMEREGREGEGVPIGCGYIKPLYLMPLFQYRDNKKYHKGLCPTCEDLYENKLFLTLYHAPNSTIEDCNDVVDAFEKVWVNRDELRLKK